MSNYNAILLSNQRLDYTKADRSEVHANICDFLAVPRDEYEGRNRDGFIIHNIYNRDGSRCDLRGLTCGTCCNIDYYSDRWGRTQLLSCEPVDVVDIGSLFGGGDNDA